jgi:hypothetical protein
MFRNFLLALTIFYTLAFSVRLTIIPTAVDPAEQISLTMILLEYCFFKTRIKND